MCFESKYEGEWNLCGPNHNHNNNNNNHNHNNNNNHHDNDNNRNSGPSQKVEALDYELDRTTR